MTYEFNLNDSVSNDVPNPFKIENIFLLLAATVLIGGAVSILFDARTYFHDHYDKVATATVMLAVTLFSIAVKFLITALSQIRFYLGRKYPVGLADEDPVSHSGMAKGGIALVETLRQSAIEFPEPRGPLNGVLYALIKPLITAPPPIQAAAVQHFHAVIAMTGILLSMAASFFFAASAEYEGAISWMYLPMTGLSLLTPFMKSQTEVFNAEEAGNANKLLWTLIGLMAFAILAPVVIPRYMPPMHMQPLWAAPFLLLTTSMVASMIFLLALFAQLDSARQTSVSFEQTTISMNCHPAQLWPKLDRDLQNNWGRGIPNRVYANVVPGGTNTERDSFQGYVLAETQPTAFINMDADNLNGTISGIYRRYMIALCVWGLLLSVTVALVGYYYAPRFINMERMEISRVMLVIIALVVTTILTFRIGHLLWSRMYFKSRLFLIAIEGTFQSGEICVGNQFTGHVQSRSTVTRVQDATLRMWASDITTVSFGKASKRFIFAMAPADIYVQETIAELKEFALNQSSVTAPTSIADIEIAKSIGHMNEAICASFSTETGSSIHRDTMSHVTATTRHQANTFSSHLDGRGLPNR